MKILLVEDQVPERNRTKELLETNGFVVDETASAKEAVAFARVYDYDAGIVDLHLSSPPTKMEGLELIGDVRRLRRAYFPILVLTLRDDIETEVKVFEAGANEFISKPLLPKVLLIRLHAMIQAAQRRSHTVGGMTLEHGPITLDIVNAEVRVDGEKVAARTGGVPPAEIPDDDGTRGVDDGAHQSPVGFAQQCERDERLQPRVEGEKAPRPAQEARPDTQHQGDLRIRSARFLVGSGNRPVLTRTGHVPGARIRVPTAFRQGRMDSRASEEEGPHGAARTAPAVVPVEAVQGQSARPRRRAGNLAARARDCAFVFGQCRIECPGAAAGAQRPRE